MDRAQKTELVTTLNKAFNEAGVVIAAHYKGLNVADMTTLRTKMSEAGATVRVAKNRLVKLALEGTESEGIKNLFKGPTVIAYSSDPIAAPKVAVEFAKDNDNLVVLGGAMGNTVLDVNGVKSLAALPSLDELRAKLIAMISTPATRLAVVTKEPASKVARVINAYASK